MRLLIAEKDYEIANAIQTLLERSNYSVDLVNNGDDAFSYVLSDTYDGVILDARLTEKYLEVNTMKILLLVTVLVLSLSMLAGCTATKYEESSVTEEISEEEISEE